MKTIVFIIQKEFRQIFRNKGMLPIIFVLPILQLLILSNAASFEVKNIAFSYIDHDHSNASRELISKFAASNYFKIIQEFDSKAHFAVHLFCCEFLESSRSFVLNKTISVDQHTAVEDLWLQPLP